MKYHNFTNRNNQAVSRDWIHEATERSLQYQKRISY
jgi:hypothetical protein